MPALGTQFGPRVTGTATETSLLDLLPAAPPPIPPEKVVEVAAALCESFFTADGPVPAPPPSPYLTAKEAAKYLKKSYSWFRKHATKIPRHDSGTYHTRNVDEFKRTAMPDKKRSRKKPK